MLAESRVVEGDAIMEYTDDEGGHGPTHVHVHNKLEI